MSTFSWILIVVGLFLVIHAALTLLRPRRGPNGGRRAESIGCGFTLLAGVVWGWAFGQYLDGWWAGMRLGFALAFILPALATLVHPRRKGVLAAVIMLTLAVLLGAPVVPRLIKRIRPSDAAATVDDLQAAVNTLKQRITATGKHITRLEEDKLRVKDQITELGHTSFDALFADTAGQMLIKELAEIETLLAQAQTSLVKAGRDVVQIESALRRVQRLSQAESATGEVLSKAELRTVLDDVNASAAASGPRTVESYDAQEQLRELYEQEF